MVFGSIGWGWNHRIGTVKCGVFHIRGMGFWMLYPPVFINNSTLPVVRVGRLFSSIFFSFSGSTLIYKRVHIIYVCLYIYIHVEPPQVCIITSPYMCTSMYLCVYRYTYIYSGSLDPNMWIPRWIYLYTYIYRWIYLYTYIYILSLSPFMARSRYEAVRITMEICRCPPFSAPWIGNWRKDPGEPRCDMEGPKKLIGQPWKMVVEWKFNQQ